MGSRACCSHVFFKWNSFFNKNNNVHWKCRLGFLRKLSQWDKIVFVCWKMGCLVVSEQEKIIPCFRIKLEPLFLWQYLWIVTSFLRSQIWKNYVASQSRLLCSVSILNVPVTTRHGHLTTGGARAYLPTIVRLHNGVFSKWIRNSVNSTNSENLINYWSMNRGQLIDPFCYLCLAGAVVTSWSLTKDVAGSNNLFKIKYFFVTEFSEFNWSFFSYLPPPPTHTVRNIYCIRI